MELLVGLLGYCVSASALVVFMGWKAPDWGMQPSEAVWETVKAVTLAPAILAVIALGLVAFG